MYVINLIYDVYLVVHIPMYLNYCDVSAVYVATLKKMSLEYCMHNSLLAYVCFQHASYFTIYIGIRGG